MYAFNRHVSPGSKGTFYPWRAALLAVALLLGLLLSACGAVGQRPANGRTPGSSGAYGRGNGSGPGSGFGPGGGMGPGMGTGPGRGMEPGMMGGGQLQSPAGTPYPTSTPGGTATVSYQNEIQPIFNQNCTSCHGGQGGLYLDSYGHVMAGTSTGPVVVPGKPDDSELVRRIEGLSQPRMPLGGSPLSQAEINAIVAWIQEGAPNN